MNKYPINFTIMGNPITKKNSQRIAFNKGRALILQSKAYLQYEKDCRWYMPKIETIREPINVRCVYYMKTKRKVDLTNLLEATDDIMTKYKVIEDDNRDIIASHNGSIVLYDKNNPRVEIEITKLVGYEKWRKD